MKSSLIIKPQHKYRIIALVVPVLLIISSFIMLSSIGAKITTHQQNIVDINLKQQSYEEADSLNRFVDQNVVGLDKMSMSIPSESMMVGALQDLEAVVYDCDPEGKVKLSGQNPVRVGKDLVIPLTVTFRSATESATKCIENLMQLPYFIQILAVDSQVSNDSTLTITNARMYVQDPFTGY